jgi:hypothetical protein
MVKFALLELVNVSPVVVLPEMETRYAAGLATVREDGIMNVTRRVLPATVVTAVAVAMPVGPTVAGCN